MPFEARSIVALGRLLCCVRAQKGAQPFGNRLIRDVAVKRVEHVLAMAFTIEEGANPAIDRTGGANDGGGGRGGGGGLEIVHHGFVWLVHWMATRDFHNVNSV